MKKLILSALFAVFLPVFGAAAETIYYSCADGSTYEDYAEIDSEYTIQSHCPSGTYDNGNAGDSILVSGDMYLNEQVTYYNITYQCSNGTTHTDSAMAGMEYYISYDYCNNAQYYNNGEYYAGQSIYPDGDIYLSADTLYYNITYQCYDGNTYTDTAEYGVGYTIGDYCSGASYDGGTYHAGDVIYPDGDLWINSDPVFHTITYNCGDMGTYSDTVEYGTEYMIGDYCSGAMFTNGQRAGEYIWVDGDITLTVDWENTFKFDCNGHGNTVLVAVGDTVPDINVCDIPSGCEGYWIQESYWNREPHNICDEIHVFDWQYFLRGPYSVYPGYTLYSYDEKSYKLTNICETDTKLDLNGGIITSKSTGETVDLPITFLTFVEGCGFSFEFPLALTIIHHNIPDTIFSDFDLSFTKGDQRLVGWSLHPNGDGGYIIYMNDKNGDGTFTEDEFDSDLSALLPTHKTLYAVWDGDAAQRLSINIDWNGGTVTNLMEDGATISGVWSLSDALGIPQSDLAQMSGMDITEIFIGTDSLGASLVAACQSGDVMCMNPGHTLVGFSPSPDGMVENPTCIFPDCNTFYAIWTEQTLQMCPTYKYIKTSTGLSVPLYATKNTTPSINIGIGGNVCYANLILGRATNAINVEYNGQIYHTEQ